MDCDQVQYCNQCAWVLEQWAGVLEHFSLWAQNLSETPLRSDIVAGIGSTITVILRYSHCVQTYSQVASRNAPFQDGAGQCQIQRVVSSFYDPQNEVATTPKGVPTLTLRTTGLGFGKHSWMFKALKIHYPAFKTLLWAPACSEGVRPIS